jgi:hypothetical protein
MDAARGRLKPIKADRHNLQQILGTKFRVNDSTRPFYFAVQQLSGLG